MKYYNFGDGNVASTRGTVGTYNCNHDICGFYPIAGGVLRT